MKPVRALRPLVRQLVPKGLRDEVRRVIRATPAAGLYTLTEDEHALIDEELGMLGAGPWNEPLSHKSTAGMTERVVEIPWVLSRYRGEQHVLDIGTAWAREPYKRGLAALQIPALYGVDLIDAPVEGVRMTSADVRHMPYRDGSFELVICVSTLEHIGLDNAVYGTPAPMQDDGDLAALLEFRRILSPRGRLLVTVPFGVRERLDYLQQYDEAAWDELIKNAGLEATETAIYAYSDVRGWRRVSLDNPPRKAFQADGAPAATGVLCADLTVRA